MCVSASSEEEIGGWDDDGGDADDADGMVVLHTLLLRDCFASRHCWVVYFLSPCSGHRGRRCGIGDCLVLTVANIRHLLVMLLSTTVDSGKTEYTICRYIRRSSCSRLTIGMIRSPIFVSIHGRSGSQRPAAKAILSETPHIVLQPKKGRHFFSAHDEKLTTYSCDFLLHGRVRPNM